MLRAGLLFLCLCVTLVVCLLLQTVQQLTDQYHALHDQLDFLKTEVAEFVRSYSQDLGNDD